MIKLNLQGIPPSLNVWSRMHWAKAAKEKKQWENDIFYSFLATDRRNYTSAYEKAKVRITFYFKTHARRDIDNMNLKFLLDGLVKAGIIKDDSVNVIGQVEVIPAFDKVNPRTEIEVWEVKP